MGKKMVGKNSEPPGKSEWDAAAIRDLLTAAFDDEELTVLCYDHFRPVHEGFSTGMSKRQKIQRLLAYCERHNRVSKLLDRVKHANPSKYAEFASKLKQRSGTELPSFLQTPTGKPPDAPPTSPPGPTPPGTVPPAQRGLWDWLSHYPAVSLAIGCVVVVLITTLFFQLLRCVIEFRMTEATVALIALLAVGAVTAFKVVPQQIREVSRSFYGGFAATLLVVVLVMKFLPPPSEGECFATSTPNGTSTPTDTLTPTSTPSPTNTPTFTPMPTLTPTITPTPTPDCRDVQVSHLELVLVDESGQQTSQRYPGQNEIVIERFQIDRLENLLGRAMLTGANVENCTCYWEGQTNVTVPKPINSPARDCGFSIGLPDEVTAIYLWLTVGGQTRLFIIRIR